MSFTTYQLSGTGMKYVCTTQSLYDAALASMRADTAVYSNIVEDQPNLTITFDFIEHD